MAERRIVTVVFADVVGFTSLSEALDPEDVATIQDAYFAAVQDVLERYGGVLEKFIGDAAVAVFGVPRTRDDDAVRAVRAALALHRSIATLGGDLGLEPGRLALRVGVNGGEVAHTPGDHGAGRVTGDVVNVAARLQAAAEPGRVLVGPETALAVAAAFDLEPAGVLELKGKAEGLRAHVVRAERPEPSRAAALGRLRAPTIGREAELALLAAALAEAGAGARAALVVAPPGVGKSRLVAEFVRRAGAGDVPVRVWRAMVDPTDGPFAPVAALLLDALRGSGLGTSPAAGPGATGRELEVDQIEGVLAERLGAAGVVAARDVAAEVGALLRSQPTTADLEARVGAWLTALRVLEGQATAIWLVEDVHVATPETLDVLARAAASPDAHRLVLATARPGVLTAASPWVAGVTSRLDLASLEDDATVELVGALIGGALPAALVDRVAEAADGNPLFVEELLRTWLALGVLREEEGAFVLAASPDDITVPTTVRSLYTAQLDDLPDVARHLAQRGAVVGETFAVAALVALAGDVAEDGARDLRDRAVVEGPTNDVLGEAYTYRHALLADAAYRSLSRRERGDLHVTLAVWLEGRPEAGALVEAMAHHWDAALGAAPGLVTQIGGLPRGEVVVRAIDRRTRASEAALAASAHETAASHARRLLGLVEDGSFEELEGHRLLGTALAFGDDITGGIEELVLAVDGYRRLLATSDHVAPDPAASDPGAPDAVRESWARAAVALSRARFDQVRFDVARDVADEAITALASADPVLEGHLVVRRTIAVAGMNDAETPQSFRDDVERVLTVARERDEPVLELAALEAILSYEQNSARALDLDQRRELLARQLGRWRSYLDAARARASLLGLADREPAEEALLEVVSLATSLGLGDPHAFGLYGLAELHLSSGAWEDAVRLARESIAVGERHGALRARLRSLFVLAPLAGIRGDEDLLVEVVAGIGQIADDLPQPPSPFAHMMFGGLARIAGRSLGVDLSADAAVLDLHGLPSMQLAAEAVAHAAIADGDLEGVAAAVERARGELASVPSPRHLIAASLDLVDAWLALGRGDRAAAVPLARSSVESARAHGAPWWTCRALRVLESVGVATPGEFEERIRLELVLGVANPQRPPVTPAGA